MIAVKYPVVVGRDGRRYAVVTISALPKQAKESMAGSAGLALICLSTLVCVGVGVWRAISSPDAAEAEAAKPARPPAAVAPANPGQAAEQCKNPTGNVKILCEGLKYDPYGYSWGGGHYGGARDAGARFVREFKSGKYPPGSSVLDCSSLVGVAVFEAFGVDDVQVVRDYRHSKNWKEIAIKDAKPGDILYFIGNGPAPGNPPDHVVIVYENSGDGKLAVFEAYSSDVRYADQIRISRNQRYSRFSGAMTYVGPGSRG